MKYELGKYKATKQSKDQRLEKSSWLFTKIFKSSTRTALKQFTLKILAAIWNINASVHVFNLLENFSSLNNYDIEMTFEEGNQMYQQKKEEKLLHSTLKAARRKLFITFIRYQNVNSSMIKWPNGDINRDELFLLLCLW